MEENIIQTSFGEYKYHKKHFERGESGKIDRDISKQNLIDFNQIMKGQDIKFGLIYGTLLGAYREKNFIEYDEDTDLYILMEDREKLLDSLFILKDNGFTVGRYNNGELLTLLRNEQYIDLYFFKKSLFGKRRCDGNVIKAKFLEKTKEFELFGQMINIPYKVEDTLKYLYGKNWRTPIQNAPADNYGWYLSVKLSFEKKFPRLFSSLLKIKKSLLG